MKVTCNERKGECLGLGIAIISHKRGMPGKCRVTELAATLSVPALCTHREARAHNGQLRTRELVLLI